MIQPIILQNIAVQRQRLYFQGRKDKKSDIKERTTMWNTMSRSYKGFEIVAEQYFQNFKKR